MPADFRIAYPKCLAEYREASKILSQELAGAIYADDLKEMGADFFETLFAPALKIAQERDIPLYCGEYGVIDLADNDSKIRWAADICSVFNKYGIGRATGITRARITALWIFRTLRCKSSWRKSSKATSYLYLSSKKHVPWNPRDVLFCHMLGSYRASGSASTMVRSALRFSCVVLSEVCFSPR